jgi:multiple sugar transport system permease protein
VPYTLSGAAVAVVWSFIVQDGGGANVALSALGVPGGSTSFLKDAPTNTIAMVIASTWQSLGVNALLFIVGMQSIPRDPVEAAMLDGASGWTLFRRITWPLLRPITVVVVGLAIVASLKTFDIVWVMTQGGPGRSSETLAVTMYKDAFVGQNYGYGAAFAVLLSVVAGVGSILYLRRQLRTG